MRQREGPKIRKKKIVVIVYSSHILRQQLVVPRSNIHVALKTYPKESGTAGAVSGQNEETVGLAGSCVDGRIEKTRWT
jgi:hypothetical protein